VHVVGQEISAMDVYDKSTTSPSDDGIGADNGSSPYSAVNSGNDYANPALRIIYICIRCGSEREEASV